ncbi:ankyrin repeat domain-containing protein [Parachlamydia sp. AcF125]|uniref:ankyrin repeat domain-containing protein n=1 Tax=Parachlamydia sp. AcF125 TaxID=2795736 RepID=UPI001BC9ADDE|nr:ankyrin repeat domain-containing protein [Parachlamydia sp. AcF125]MBS4168695.1 hypothetical protein [Parachlamydia sp. AcF125]
MNVQPISPAPYVATPSSDLSQNDPQDVHLDPFTRVMLRAKNTQDKIFVKNYCERWGLLANDLEAVQKRAANLEIMLKKGAKALKRLRAIEASYRLNAQLASINNIKLLAHRFSLCGTSQLNEQTFALDNLDHRNAFQALYDSLERHLDSPLKETILSNLQAILKMEEERDTYKKAQTLLEEYQQGKIIFLALRAESDRDVKEGHRCGFLLKEDCLIKLNKGGRLCQPAGLHIYKLNDPSLLTAEFIQKMLGCCIPLYYFEEAVDEELGLTPQHYIPTTPQKGGFWAWALAKLVLRGMLFLESGNDEKEQFKKWSQTDRLHAAQEYLKGENTNPQIMASVWCRTTNSALNQILERQLKATPTHITDEKSTPLHLAAESNNIPAVQHLLTKGGDINCEDHQGRTPLMIAACLGRYEMVDYLLKNGAEINKIDKNGVSAYCHLSIQGYHYLQNPKMESRLKVVKKILIENGANKNLSKFFAFLRHRGEENLKEFREERSKKSTNGGAVT